MANNDEIKYEFDTNREILDVIQRATHDAEEMRTQVDKLFQVLVEEAYHGQGAEAMQSRRQDISTRMDSIISDLHHTHAQAVAQHDYVQQLDQRQAANILG
ncbi:hypothetical protein [Mycobacterium vicinigordonae]|uniref:ESAT-6-like protein n=1 Tax=Mycobacterium vicinigordonae TaxID=1719132 RepID=A0A7D6I3G6_9MYCO|nr:hypothetical protein [Mycobacterium vicinigordonae]QLL05998.1 hypothetical protein H0P51_19735 [Mycobacterium vicinigordonae]